MDFSKELAVISCYGLQINTGFKWMNGILFFFVEGNGHKRSQYRNPGWYPAEWIVRDLKW